MNLFQNNHSSCSAGAIGTEEVDWWHLKPFASKQEIEEVQGSDYYLRASSTIAASALAAGQEAIGEWKEAGSSLPTNLRAEGYS